MRTISALLTVHNRKAKTLSSLEALFKNTLPDGWVLNVYLTDDACTDGTPEEVRNRFPQVHIINGNGKLFWNRGMIEAWEEASRDTNPDLYLWLNDDTILNSDAVARLIHCHIYHPYAVISGSVSSEKYKTAYGGVDSNLHIIHPADHPIECYTFHGNVVLVPQSCYKILGTLDPKFSHAIGDYDYGLRARKAGFINYIAPGYYGKCERDNKDPLWMQPGTSFFKKIRNLFSPLAYTPPKEYFIFKKRHYGLRFAILAMGSIGLHLIAPVLWRKVRKPGSTV